MKWVKGEMGVMLDAQIMPTSPLACATSQSWTVVECSLQTLQTLPSAAFNGSESTLRGYHELTPASGGI